MADRPGRLGGALTGALALLVALGGAVHGVPVPAAAAPVNRATVVVDTGQGVITRIIEFTSSSVTGLQALDLAGADPVIWSYSGQGGAVCRLFGVGRDAGPGCLGGDGGDARYWAYHRATNGATKFAYSSVGAGSTSVHDGDVEGWRFGLGGAPPFPAVTPPSTAAPVTVPPANAPAGPAVSAGGSGGGGGAGAVGTGSSETTATTVGPPASTLPDTGRASTARRAAADRGTAVLASGRRDARTAAGASTGSGSDGPRSLLLFGVLFAALVVAIVLVRRRRRPVR